jgi:hypothetical protein
MRPEVICGTRLVIPTLFVILSEAKDLLRPMDGADSSSLRSSE